MLLYWILIYCILLTYFPMSSNSSIPPFSSRNRLCRPGIHHRAPNCQPSTIEVGGSWVQWQLCWVSLTRWGHQRAARCRNEVDESLLQPQHAKKKKTYKRHQTTTTLELPCVSFLDLSLLTNDFYAYKQEQQSKGIPFPRTNASQAKHLRFRLLIPTSPLQGILWAYHSISVWVHANELIFCKTWWSIQLI